MTETFHPLVKRLLDGELSLGDLPPGLRGEGAEALRLLGAVDRTPVALSVQLEARVMAEVRRRARSPMRRIWRGLVEPRDIELRLRLRPWVVWGTALAAAAAVALLLTRPSPGPRGAGPARLDRKSTRLNSSHSQISYAVFCLKKKKTQDEHNDDNRTDGVPGS